MDDVLLAARTARPRHEASSVAADEIQRCGGMITDARQFSNLGLLLRFDIEAGELITLLDRLDQNQISVADESRVAVVRLPVDGGEIDAKLHIRFYGDEPDLRVPTPAVPG